MSGAKLRRRRQLQSGSSGSQRAHERNKCGDGAAWHGGIGCAHRAQERDSIEVRAEVAGRCGDSISRGFGRWAVDVQGFFNDCGRKRIRAFARLAGGTVASRKYWSAKIFLTAGTPAETL